MGSGQGRWPSRRPELGHRLGRRGRRLSKIWQQEPDRQLELAKWIVADWGGVRGNRPARLQQHLVTAQMDSPATPFLGLSSYSKILAVRDPDRFAILDARVVVALNALQILAGNRQGLAFPYIQGRNVITGHQLKKKGFACKAEFSVQSLVEGRGWQRVPRDEVYDTYLRILQGWLLVNPSEAELMLVEMALFSQAEVLAERAIALDACTFQAPEFWGHHEHSLLAELR